MSSTKRAKPSLLVDYWSGSGHSKSLVTLDLQALPEIQLEWVASRLARIYRNVGTSTYTVLDHSLAVHDMLPEGASGELRLYALLHDAAEALIGDVPSPVKRAIPSLRRLEDKIHKQLLGQFWPDELPEAAHLKLLHDLVKINDRRSYELERTLQLPEQPVDTVEKFLDLYAQACKLILRSNKQNENKHKRSTK